MIQVHCAADSTLPASRARWGWGLVLLVIAGITTASVFAKGPASGRLQGRISGGSYASPAGIFTVAVPEMRNPFIKKPSLVADRLLPDGGAEVDFAVLDLGEAHRFGARALNPDSEPELMHTQEIERWVRHWAGTMGEAELLVEAEVQLADGAGLGRIYHVQAASLLFGSKGGAQPQRESALVGVIVVPVPAAGRVLYAVSQFDMPNRGGHYTLDTERGRLKLAEEQLKRLRSLTETLRLK